MTLTSAAPPRGARLALAALCVGVVGLGAMTVLRQNGEGPGEIGHWFCTMLTLAAAGVVATRAWSDRSERLIWSLIAAGMLIAPLRSILFPFGAPSSLRPLWLLFYPLVLGGLLLLLRKRLKRLPVGLGLDAMIAGFAVAAVATIAFDRYREATGGSPAVVALAVAFPAGDLLLVALTAGALSALGWRAGRRWALLFAGFSLYAVADIFFTLHVAAGTYVRGSWFDALRPAVAQLLAAVSWMAPDPIRPRLAVLGRGNAVPQLVFTITMVGILVLNDDGRSSRVAALLSACGLVAVIARFAVTFREVTKLADRHQDAMTDDLTKLANRQAMSTALTAASFEYTGNVTDERDGLDGLDGRRGLGPGLLLLDLDRFREINDSLGHLAGDQLLCEVAERLSRTVRSEDLLARVGGDEFAVLLPPGIGRAAAETLATRIVEALDEPFLLSEMTVRIEASIGIALCPDYCPHPEELLQCADVAMCRSKGTPDRVAVYDTAYDTRRKDERQMIDELRAAVADGQLTCHYQPKIRADDGRVHSVEALVRWQHPTRGLLSPAKFLQHAELGGLMRPLTTAVLHLALGQTRTWRDRGIEMTVAVNLSVTNLLDVDLVAHIRDLLRLHRLPPDALILEITEGVLTSDSMRSSSVVESLQRLGVKLSIDDFGTGWSSLARLREMTVDELKLDGVFVDSLADDPRSIAIVRSTVALAHSLGASLVAEGVEDVETLQALRIYGCDITQGYVHCPPLPPDELDRWLHTWHGGSAPGALSP